MIGREEDQVISLSDFRVQEGEESCEVLIETELDVFYFDGVRSVFMADIVRRGAIDGEKIRRVALTKRIPFYGCPGEVQGEGIAEGRTADIVMVFLVCAGDVM